MKAKHLSARAKYTATGWLQWVAAIVCVTILSSCRRGHQETRVDRSILTDDPCAAPCWQGILPGVTTAAEVSDILQRLDFIDQDRLWASEREYFAWHSTASDADPAVSSYVLSRAGVVSGIEIGLDFELSLGEVMEKYGPPEKFVAYQSPRVEKIQSDVHFFYPQRGLIFTSWIDGYVPPGEPLMLVPSTLVTFVRYFAPAPIENLMREYPELNTAVLHGEDYWQDWPGYGPVKLLR